jgi:cytochrome c oxidase cbb3-type subunit 3
MNFLTETLSSRRVFQALLLVGFALALLQVPPIAGQSASTTASQTPPPAHQQYAPPVIASGADLFQQNCAFCHGRDAGGGETGPDLTRSKLVSTDIRGENIESVVRNGRVEKGMPGFSFSAPELTSLVAFIHSQQDKAMSQSGKRKGVDVSDLQTGNVESGKQYFNGAGGCASCHSVTGDLSGIASRYQGLKLEEQMLYPKDAKSIVAVTLPSGKVFKGTLAYRDEFTVALIDPGGTYHSWSASKVKYKVDAPVNAHVELFDKYTDDDIHNLMAYLQTIR